MTATQEQIEAVARKLDDAKCYLTRAYAANDPEIKEIVKVVIRAYEATQPSVPSDEELESAFWEGYHKFRYVDLADDPEPQMERLVEAGIRAVRERLVG